MADYFINFSFMLPLKSEEQQKYALEMHVKMSALNVGDATSNEGIPEMLLDIVEDWCFEAEADDNHSLWVHSENGGIDSVCTFVQHLLQKYESKDVIFFEWSNDCSKPRLDAYGGGAALVTAKEIRTMNTYDWLVAQPEFQAAEAAS